MRLTKKFTLLLFLAILCNNIYCQVDDYFDNGFRFDFKDGETNAINIFKIDLLSSLQGDISLFWERRIIEEASIEVGLGYLTSPFIPEIIPITRPYSNTNTNTFSYNAQYAKETGFSYRIMTKYYTNGWVDFYFNYVGFKLSQKYYYFPDNQRLTASDLYFASGRQFRMFSRITLDYCMYVGARFINSTYYESQNVDDKDADIHFAISIKIGFMHKYDRKNAEYLQ